jgi:GNAT superfamily N-acetyltransferase
MVSFSETLLLSRIEDASLNASAPPQQRWMDGWLVRTNPGKARRARSINAVATGRLPLAEKLRLAQAVFDEAGLPLVIRITRFTQPEDLDSQLAAAGWVSLDNTQVLVCPHLPPPARAQAPPPAGLTWTPLDAEAYAAAVGTLRGSPAEQQAAHAHRLRASPIPYRGYALQDARGQTLACGQWAREADLVGLYDVFTHSQVRGQGLSYWLCKRLLSLAAHEGATTGYLQVEADNAPAQAVYRKLGFEFGYGYHYRQPPGTG